MIYKLTKEERAALDLEDAKNTEDDKEASQAHGDQKEAEKSLVEL